ncbi:hypothetical protein BSKO_05832 [Bryopsis sp. KO-2023]|nr:hypothetical protein BSKO_05832 [Bryopsis sp. KO-2023]
MQNGSFYCFVPRRGQASGWLPHSKAVQRDLHRRINDLLKSRFYKSGEDGASYLSPPSPDVQDDYHHDPETGTHKLVLPGGAVSLQHGWYELAGGVYKMQPFLFRTDRAVIVFYGYLSNVDELRLRMGLQVDSILTKTSPLRCDPGSLTASTVLQLYLDRGGKDPIVMLSDLQGQYSFVIYDSGNKQVFAARDPGGKQPIYYSPTSAFDNGVAFTDEPLDIPNGEAKSDWVEIPPGHFVSGKNPRLQQFALTPEQLQSRESMEIFDEEWWECASGGTSPIGGSFGAGGFVRSLQRRRSLFSRRSTEELPSSQTL